MSKDSSDLDGRTARRESNRVAVLDAVIALFAEGHLRPTPEEVADRSGVSRRSVYRYYSDPDELRRAAIGRHLERLVPLMHISAIGEGPLPERIDRFVDGRLALHDRIGAVARAARVASAYNDEIRAQTNRTRDALREQTERHFRPELAARRGRERRALAVAIDALAQLEVIDYYRGPRGLSLRETGDVLRTAMATLLGG